MKATDPVCGMTIEQESAVATATHEGKTYYFCSDEQDHEGENRSLSSPVRHERSEFRLGAPPSSAG